MSQTLTGPLACGCRAHAAAHDLSQASFSSSAIKSLGSNHRSAAVLDVPSWPIYALEILPTRGLTLGTLPGVLD